MDGSWIARGLTPVIVGVMFAVFRKYFPARPRPDLDRYDREPSDRLPTGAFSAITILLGLVIGVGGYFVLHGANRLIARLDGPVLLQVYPISAIWIFLPGFAALAVPWPFMIAVLRRSRFRDDAAYIEARGSAKSGFDCFRVMLGMNWFVVVPLALFTILALPERLSLGRTAILWTHYASVRPEVFAYADARRATLVEGYLLRDGTFRNHPDLLLEFADGRTLDANAVADGGSEPSREEIRILLEKTGLVPAHRHVLQARTDVKQEQVAPIRAITLYASAYLPHGDDDRHPEEGGGARDCCRTAGQESHLPGAGEDRGRVGSCRVRAAGVRSCESAAR